MRRRIEEIDLLACAYLFGEEKHQQQEIARTLHLSQATVSRLIEKARKEFLRDEIRFLKDKIDNQTMEMILRRISRKDLGKKLEQLSLEHTGKRGPIVRVFSSGSRDDSPAGWEARLKVFSQNAAPYVKELLLRADLCGVSWGASLGNIVLALQKLSVPTPWSDTGRQIKVIPLCGEPLGNQPTSFSSSNLAADLEQLLNGNNKESLSLGMVPAFIPAGLTRAELKGVWKLIELVKAYDEIMGKHAENLGHRDSKKNNWEERQAPLVDQLDMVLTSVGPSERLLGYGSSELLRTGDLDIRELQKLVLGDISGVFIPRPDLSASQRVKLKDLSKRWTGIKLEHLKNCSLSSFSSDPLKGKPGIVVVAIGKNKARFIYEGTKLNLINHLVIDDDLEEELERIVKK